MSLSSAAPTHVASFTNDDGWQSVYDQELAALLSRKLGAREVIVFDHTVRVDDPSNARKPARNVHTDYSPEGARRRLIDIVGTENAEAWSRGHYAFINVWRPIAHTIHSAPLGFVRPSSVSREDWILIDLIYPDRQGHIMGLVANDEHEWLYRSKMTPDEVAFFTSTTITGRPRLRTARSTSSKKRASTLSVRASRAAPSCATELNGETSTRSRAQSVRRHISDKTVTEAASLFWVAAWRSGQTCVGACWARDVAIQVTDRPGVIRR